MYQHLLLIEPAIYLILRLSAPNPSEIYVLAKGLFHNVHMKCPLV